MNISTKINFYYVFFLVLGCFMSCTDKATSQDPIPTHVTLNIESKEVGETRVINIWTPPNYDGSKDAFPVLYMPDGGIQEDFPHIANTIAALIQSKKINPIILVGIENTQRRRDLTGKTEVKEDKEIAPIVGGSEAFRSFIQKELIPEIDSKYRTTKEKGIIGESLAGLFVTETFLLYPQMFDFYIAFDPSLWWNDKKLLKDASKHLSAFSGGQKRYWFAGSSAEDIYVSTRLLSKVLDSAKVENLKWQYSDEPKEEHSTIFRATKEKAIIWAMNAR
ncbi:MAG TPA: alpha/beta hydrolase-fold protein [Saprospiraceae bacterium]|nr:alpha/beta hydrolase-fold protein [Saprospiraceae bacterium]